MNHDLARVLPRAIALFALAGTVPLISQRAIAQDTYPACEPPDAGEYLLLVQGDTETAEAQLQEAFPEGADITVCTYIDRVITRVGGFSDAETATAWAQYLSDIGGLDAYVARPAEPDPEEETSGEETSPPDAETADPAAAGSTETDPAPESMDEAPESAPPADTSESSSPGAASESPEPTAQSPDATTARMVTFPAPTLASEPSAPEPATPNATPGEGVDGSETAIAPAPETTSVAEPGYNPQVLGEGYAVLVDYANQPEVATRLLEAVGANVGLAVYNQQPYLLAAYTADGDAASEVLRTLSDQFTAVLVDGRRVILLSPAIALVP